MDVSGTVLHCALGLVGEVVEVVVGVVGAQSGRVVLRSSPLSDS